MPTDAQAGFAGWAPSRTEPLPGRARDAGIRLVVTYKAGKAAAELLAFVGLVGFASAGTVHEVTRFIGGHIASRWSIATSAALNGLLSGQGLHLLETGFVLDGLLTALEGWSLWKGFRWGPWLVVIAGLLPLPWELSGIATAFSWPRVALATINVAVVGYLGWRIAWGRRA